MNAQKKTIPVTTTSGATFKALRSWDMHQQQDLISFTAPEKDLELHVMESSYVGDDAAQLLAAWQRIDPSFNLKPLSTMEIPPQSSWEKFVVVMYETPATESLSVAGMLLKYRDTAYLFLQKGTTAGASRRGADIQMMLSSFRPLNFAEISYQGTAAHPWSVDETREFTQFVVDTLRESNVPGAAIAIVDKEGRELYKHAFGVKNSESQEPVDSETPFMIGSTTKALTSLLMARLVDKGLISWNTLLTDQLADFSTGSEAFTRRLTMRASISAASGMPRRDFDFIFRYQGISGEQRLAEMRSMQPTTQEGETFQYSNYLYMAGGYAAARSINKTDSLEHAYRSAMHSLVLAPLKMDHTVLSLSEAIALGGATPHTWTATGGVVSVPLEIEGGCQSVLPAGGAWSTASDMGRYIAMELNLGKSQGEQFVSNENLLERRKSSIAISDKIHYGLGLMVQDEQGIAIVQHGGNTLGFSSDMFFFPEHGLGCVVLTNKRGANGFLASVRQKFLELTFGLPEKSKAIRESFKGIDAQFTKILWSKVSFAPQDLAPLTTLAGTYTNEYLGKMEICQDVQGAFKARTNDWILSIGVETKEDQSRFLVLKESPSDGTFRFLVQQEGSLLLDGGQTKYIFVRTP